MNERHVVRVALWAPGHLSAMEVAEMVNDKLRTAGSVLVVDNVRVVPDGSQARACHPVNKHVVWPWYRARSRRRQARES